MAMLPALLAISKLLSFLTQISCTTDVIAQSQSLHDGSTLISKDGTFELGFFSPGSSTNRYVGIWYRNIPVKTIVWVANRDNPAKDNSSKLMISKEGNLALLSQTQTLLWSTNTTAETSLSPIVQLLDTGNLVVRDGNSDNNNEENFLWQSFDHPSDKMLPGMKLGWNLKTGRNRRFTSWKNWDDPSTGDFTWGIDPTCNPEMVMWKGLVESYRSGPWNGIRFSGSPTMRENPVYDYKFVNNSDELYFTYNLKNKSVISIIVMNQTLYLRQRFTWIPGNKTWRIYHSIPRDNCDSYNLCGPNGNCVDGQSPICQCLEGFKPKSSQNWEAMDWSQGCVRREAWSCGVKDKDGFRRFTGLKLPDTTQSWVNESMTLEDCKAKCLGNCSCAAYSYLDVRGEGSGCAIWFGDLVNLRIIESGQDIYIRMAVPEIATNGDVKHGHKKVALVITIPFVCVLVLLLVIFCIYKTKRKYMEQTDKTLATEKKHEEGQEDLELPFFDLATIINATNDFSIDNKLGEGGFGPVYKGILEDDQEVAVKRLARASQQGLQEFKNEVILCAKLQHRNLVKVIGCCIEGEEKMLVYEYMPNRSLDSFLFDSAQNKRLDWPKRLHIINGIARGLLYLHHDSRLRIIHRDLKASNVLLDKEMNPKISDFGLARMCGGDQIEGKTSRIVGTYGYMSPEYAIDGLFSIKSDIFSFGILLLEIVSGMKNKGMFSFPSQSYNLIGYAWRLWKENILVKLIDTCLGDTLNLYEACRCIHIGLLCVQQQPDDRPNMASVVLMLNSESTLPQPKEPSFLMEKVTMERESSDVMQASSNNEVTVSVLEAR